MEVILAIGLVVALLIAGIFAGHNLKLRSYIARDRRLVESFQDVRRREQELREYSRGRNRS